ncbi:CDC14-domain-containing protein [Auriscalpium vulgare]|uniref:CDC14-domain-containing protein n=1 Tax=Auriscalpium vulgare TaxID=40419 RepID=A0ACB8SCN8_9AGAM|nr:CDC14-domain-containing protein [Auriscalpium vulgare]
MDDTIFSDQATLQDALDELAGRSSIAKHAQALGDIERVIARAFTSTGRGGGIEQFLSLQDSFECNVPSRILGWISTTSLRLDHLLNRGLSDVERESEATSLAAQLVQSLNIIQGVALTHQASKLFLGRKYSLELLLDTLIVSRHLGTAPMDTPPSTGPSTPVGSGATSTSKPPMSPLASTVLDTLLCILVDLPPALRVFEACNGVQTIVKLLKRANTPRDVRMKCLEFLYFYLLDETSARPDTSSLEPIPGELPPMPLSPSPFITDSRPKNTRYLREASSGSEESNTSSSSRSSFNSSSSNSSASSASSYASAPTTPPSHVPKTPPRTPTNRATRPFAKPRSLMLLQQDVDFVPLSPKKPATFRPGVAQSRQGSFGTPNAKANRSYPLGYSRADNVLPGLGATPSRHASDDIASDTRSRVPSIGNVHEVKTTEQKKEFLGRMLGNVDALVDGVKKAGVWGLG